MGWGPLAARLLTLTAALLLLLAVSGAAAAQAEPAPDAGRAFEPAPQSTPLYGTKAPSADPARQRKVVAAKDGVGLFVETWLPKEKNGNVPPARLPTLLVMTPYVQEGDEEYPADSRGNPGFIDYMTSRGYAVAQHHVRGTGNSGGCLEQTAANQIDDGARVVEYLGRDASWADGNVGMYGISYDAETQLSVAGRGDAEKIQYLKAIVPAASVGGQYEYSYFDGVPYTGQAVLSNAFYLAGVSAVPGQPEFLPQYFQKASCQDEVFLSSADQSGDLTPFWQEREYRPGAPNIRAATLFVHGLADYNVDPITIAGFYERLPPTTPRKGLFGVWEHAFPYRHSVEPEWQRPDWLPMVLAWYDRYLKGLDTGVERWPEVQVQATNGQWREEPDFPTTGGPVGQLALGPGGALGVADPTGSTAYTEGADEFGTESGTRAVFQTPEVTEPLHLTGQPVLDLRVRLNQPDAHLAARLDVLDATGQTIASRRNHGYNPGYRSARHLDPLFENRFVQSQGRPAPTGQVLDVQLRFHPSDLRVPPRGRLRLVVAGSVRNSLPSGSRTRVEILHSCEATSALRFLMPRGEQAQLNVREDDEKAAGPLPSNPPDGERSDGGGIATASVCGQPPARLESFGPPRDQAGGGSGGGGGSEGAGGAGAEQPNPSVPGQGSGVGPAGDAPQGTAGSGPGPSGGPPPAAGPRAVAVRAGRRFLISRRALALTRGVVRLRVSCRSSDRCRGQLRLRFAERGRRGGGKVSQLVVGRRSFSLAGRTRRVIAIRLSPAGRRMLARARSTRTLAIANLRPEAGVASGRRRTVTAAFRLVRPRPR